ncbi:class I SAM-dependent DNA methyltransferase [Pseudalkalibacillus sp. SCS-8]|uniref:HsdM family class I SAM-dependent methyltransferase n=1 Tax=Pseudalkalibacillus nanhaiensis TaxID=3115291 RepID=UPI0032DB9A6E
MDLEACYDVFEVILLGKRHVTLPDKLEGLFIRLEEIVLANSGENDFEEILKLIMAKLWCEKNETEDYIDSGTSDDTVARVNKLLFEMNKHWKGVLHEDRTKLSPGHVDVCVKLLNNYKLSEYSFQALDAFFEFIVSRTSKGSKGQFFTPRYIIDFCIKIIAPRYHENILDPASGSGAFLLHSYNYYNDHHNSTGHNLWGFDFDEKAVRVSKALMYISGVSQANVHKINSLILPELQENLFIENVASITSIEDCLRINKCGFKKFDIIVTNPPFAGEINESKFLDNYVVAKGKSRIQRDALFIERCIELLNPGGRMAIILPNNKFGSNNWAYLRKWILHHAKIVGVIGLPRNVFMPHTPVKTGILFLQKRKNSVTNIPNEEIFFGISELAGKDSRGNLQYKTDDQAFENVDHDLDEIYKDFKQFISQNYSSWVNE